LIALESRKKKVSVVINPENAKYIQIGSTETKVAFNDGTYESFPITYSDLEEDRGDDDFNEKGFSAVQPTKPERIN